MISPLMVYLVMQADSIVTFFAIAGGLAVCGGGGFYIAASEYDDDATKKLTKSVFVVGCIFVCIAAFMPTTKTAAAMIVLPAITSDGAVESVAPEVRELYDLTKDALRSLGKRKKPESDD